jgi:ABC-type sulfate transport system permease subunit
VTRGSSLGLLYGIALTTADRSGVSAVLIVSGQITGTETATLYVLRAFDQFQDDPGFVVALTLALVSVVLLVLIETFKRRQERMQRT